MHAEYVERDDLSLQEDDVEARQGFRRARPRGIAQDRDSSAYGGGASSRLATPSFRGAHADSRPVGRAKPCAGAGYERVETPAVGPGASEEVVDAGPARSASGQRGLDPLAQLLRNRLRLPLLVVVADEHAVAVRDQPSVRLRAHLEVELEARALELRRADEGADLLVEERRRAVGDVALGEDEAKRAAGGRGVVGRQRPHVVDPGRLEEAQELGVVHVLHRVEVAEADALDRREGFAVGAHSRVDRSVSWMRPIARTRYQNSVPATAMTATHSTAAWRLSAIMSRIANTSSAIASSASNASTAQ